MPGQAEIVRLQKGLPSPHPVPEAVVEPAPVGTPSEAGERLVVLVDLEPRLSHRAREIRASAVEAYWRSPGSVVARLRRALAAANRYLVRANAQSRGEGQASGNIVCAALCEDELFVGQVGPGCVLLRHPAGGVERFPHQLRQMLPLGASVPPVIHISYAEIAEGSLLFLATMELLTSLERDPARLLANPALSRETEPLFAALRAASATGTLVLLRVQPEAELPAAPPRRRAFSLFGRRKKAPEEAPEAPAPPVVEVPPPAPPAAEPAPTVAAPRIEPLPAVREEKDAPVSPFPAPVHVARPSPSADEVREEENAGQPGETALPDFLQAEEIPGEAEGPVEEARPSLLSRIRLPELHRPQLRLPQVRLSRPRLPKVRFPSLRREPQAERAPLRSSLPAVPVKEIARTLLPGPVTGRGERRPWRVPEEKTPLMAGLAVGFVLIVALITLTMAQQFGGALVEEELLQQAQELARSAYASQSRTEWQQVRTLSEQVLALNAQNTEAQQLLEESQVALDALEQASLISAIPLVDLGVSPVPRRVLVAQNWLYILNRATGELYGVPLEADGIRPASSAPTPILRQGQTIAGESVGGLVDMAWMNPGPGYPDGAIFIYSDTGTVYIYEPSLGPASITYQRLPGNLEPGNVTLVGIYGNQFYLVDRQSNQIWRYVPVNGLYDSPPRPYFAPEVAPPLQTALGLALDGRLYLLLGEGEVKAYFNGTEDLSFQMRGGGSQDRFQPMVLAMDPRADGGLIYLGEREAEALLVFDKRGDFQRRLRLPREALGNFEVLALNERATILYFVTANRLYAAPLPGVGQ